MLQMKPATEVELVWEHDLVFSGQSKGVSITLDGMSAAGPSPVQALAFAVAGCMAMDVVHVVRKGRHDLRGLTCHLTAQRAPDDPHRFTSVEITYQITGAMPREPVQRAIDLSRDKYCSVWHSLRQDIPLTVTFTITPGV
jgi:putative redox protein